MISDLHHVAVHLSASNRHDPRATTRAAATGGCITKPHAKCTYWPSRAPAPTVCHAGPHSSASDMAPAPAGRSATTTSCAGTFPSTWREVSIKGKSFRPLRVSMALSGTFMSATMGLAAPNAGVSTCAPPAKSSCLPSGVGAGSASTSPGSSPERGRPSVKSTSSSEARRL